MNKICKQLYTNFPTKLGIVGYSVDDELPKIDKFKDKSTREQEHILGRYCAKEALKALNINCNRIESNVHGSPIWPEGSVGSISHSKGLCLSAVGKTEDYQAIGIDVERFNRMKERSIERIVHDKEKAQIGNDLKKATLLFSIKEAFYKAQFPLYQCPLNFKDLALKFDFASQKAQLIWLAAKSPIPKSEYLEWTMAYQIIENTCFSLCAKSNKVDISN